MPHILLIRRKKVTEAETIAELANKDICKKYPMLRNPIKGWMVEYVLKVILERYSKEGVS